MTLSRTRVSVWLMAFVVMLLCVTCAAAPAKQKATLQVFKNFVRRDGDVLRDGDREFRFLSFNIPNLHYVEDDMRFEQGMPFRLPDAFEIDDALGTIEQMGGQVVRMYALSVKKPDDPPDLPRYILGPGQFNEQAFVALDQVIAGALLWSLRYRTREGGFYWHHEPAGGDYFKAYHWPGFEIGEKYDERRLMRFVRERAFEIQGLTAPPITKPAAPRLLSVTSGGQMTWQGSIGASCYNVERAGAARGPWTIVGAGVSEAQVQYRPLFVDGSVRPGRTYYYRVIARNPGGSSEPSSVVGPVPVTHRTLVDELWNDSRIFVKEGKLQFVENQARKVKEDCHRLSGESKSAVIYRAPGGIGAVRVFLFGPTDQPAIRISFSKGCRTFEPVEPAVARTVTYGEDAYGFWKAMRYSAAPGTPPCDFVKIEFQSEAQVSRVEIDHDHAE